MRQQDYYRYRKPSFRSYVGKLVKVTVVSLVFGAVGVTVCLIVGYYRLKPLQSIYLWRYFTSARRSSRSETGVSEYRLLIGIKTDTDAKSAPADTPKGKPKGKRDSQNSIKPEDISFCNDDEVEPVYVNGEHVKSPEGDLEFRFRQEIPDKRILWQSWTINDKAVWIILKNLVYGGQSIDELMTKPRDYGILIFAISLIAGFILATKKHFQLSITGWIRDEIRGIQQLQIMGVVVTRVDVLKGFFISSGKAASATALRAIASKPVPIPARELDEVEPLKQRTKRAARRIEPVQPTLFLTEVEQSEEGGKSNFGLELFGGKDRGEQQQ